MYLDFYYCIDNYKVLFFFQIVDVTFLSLGSDISEDRESIISIGHENGDVDPDPLSTTPSPFLSREFYVECLKNTVDRVSLTLDLLCEVCS